MLGEGGPFPVLVRLEGPALHTRHPSHIEELAKVRGVGDAQSKSVPLSVPTIHQ